jgi:ABC-type multidrug transport system ATPase subunit
MLPSTADAIQLYAVSYTYPHTDKIALSEICYSFTRGTTAIVGPNGAGKSTLVKLLTGLLTPTSGWISVQLPDGTYLPPEQLHKAVLFQEPSHLYLTIRQNITMRFEKTPNEDTRIYEALEKAGLDKVVKGLADRIDTLVGAGFGGRTDLSGGQWQRLALARRIYQDAPVIILDEPVASLDPQGERAVFELFSQLSQSRIIIFTTHRYDSIPKNTKIVVLVDGNITESGTHEQLLQQQRDYWSLYMTEASSKAVPLLAGQPGHADHAIYAMNGQTKSKTHLSLAEFALRPHAPSPETASLSHLAGESAPQFASTVGDEQVVESPGSDSFEGSALDHSASSSSSTAPASLPPTPLAPASHCNGNHLWPNMNVEMSFSHLGCEWSISSRQDDAQATTVREKDTTETIRLHKSHPRRRDKEYSYSKERKNKKEAIYSM